VATPTASRYAYPHAIDNGGGERLTFLRRIPTSNGDRLEVENVVSPGHGPPMHVHHHQVEALTVRSGRIGYQRPGQPEQFAGPGDTVTFAAGDAHRFWNPGAEPLVCTGYIEPADNIEFFLGAIYDAVKHANGGAPSLFDMAFLTTRYRSEFSMVAIPAVVRRIVFPLVVALGTVLGKYRKYADAPEPVRR
jgi:mannose-6-phosphate isomerase-like protein (cupin superfamily)